MDESRVEPKRSAVTSTRTVSPVVTPSKRNQSRSLAVGRAMLPNTRLEL